MRVPAVSVVSKIMIVAVVGLLACALMPLGSAFAEGEEAPSALLASSLMDGSASVVREDVALAAPEDDVAPEPVIGSFTVDGFTFAVTDESHVELVGVSADWQQVTDSQEGEGSGVAPMLASGSEESANLVLPEIVTYEGTTYTLTSVAPYAFYLSGAASVTLPASISDVDNRAFRSSDVANVTVAEGNPTYSSFDGALYDASQSSLLLIPEGKQGAVLLPKTAEVAEASVFSHCPLVDSISVEKDGAAFASENGLLYTSDLTTLLRVPAGATEITIREGCASIAAGALEACSSLTTINAPSTVTSISPDVFESMPTVSLLAASLAGAGDPGTTGKPSSQDAAPQLSAVVALFSASIDGLSEIVPSSISLVLPENADAAPWEAVGFMAPQPGAEKRISQSKLGEVDASKNSAALPDAALLSSIAASNSLASIRLDAGGGGFRVLRTLIPNTALESGFVELYANTPTCTEVNIVNWTAYSPKMDGVFDFNRNDGYGFRAIPSRLGYTFIGWRVEASTGIFAVDDNNYAQVPGTMDCTATALWTKDIYSVTVNPGGLELDWPYPWKKESNGRFTRSYSVDDDMSLPFLEWDGKYFVGWVGSNGQVAQQTIDIPKGSTGDREYCATWEDWYTVSYMAEHGTASKASELIRKSSSSITLPTFTPDEGWIFQGWLCSTDWRGLKPANEQWDVLSLDDKTVTASVVKKSFTVKWDPNGGEVKTASSSVQYEDTVDAPVPKRDGCYFLGWYTASTGGSQVCGGGDSGGTTGKIKEDVTYYAQWEPLYKVTFNASVGTPSVKELNIREGAKTIILPTLSGYDGWEFEGWTSSDGWEGALPADSEVTFPSAQEYIVEASYTGSISLDAGGGVFTSYEFSSSESDPADPEDTVEGKKPTEIDIATHNDSGAKKWYAFPPRLGGCFKYLRGEKVYRIEQPRRKGYKFAGWHVTAITGKFVVDDAALPLPGEMNCVAKAMWKGADIALDAGGGYFEVYKAKEPGASIDDGKDLIDSGIATYADSDAPNWVAYGPRFGEARFEYTVLQDGYEYRVIPKREGYICTRWDVSATTGDFTTDTEWGKVWGEGDIDCQAVARWAPAISADVPVEATVRVDLNGNEDQTMDDEAPGWIESRCGEPLEVESVSFTPKPGAEELFGLQTSSVQLQAIAGEGAVWDAGTSAFSFSLDATGVDAIESDAGKLAVFHMEKYQDRIPISYRFAIPDEVLAAIDSTRFENVTTPVCSVAYTVALAATEG